MIAGEPFRKLPVSTVWHDACPPFSPMRNRTALAEHHPPETQTLVLSAVEAMSLCNDPNLFSIHAYANWAIRHTDDLLPVFGSSKTTMHTDLPSVPWESFMADNLAHLPWEEKAHDELLWRGSTTGAVWHKSGNWKQGQRQRLVGMMNATGPISILLPDGLGGRRVDLDGEKATNYYLDMAFAGRPICEFSASVQTAN